MNTIPTAEEWLLNHKELSMYDVEEHDKGGYLGVNEEALYKIMTEFAKAHVKQALEAATKELPYDDRCNQDHMLKQSILNAYPESNIK